MKLCFLAAAHSAHSHRWIQFFCERGHEVHWISLDPPSKSIDPRIRFYDMSRIANRSLRIAVASARTARLLKAINPEVIHAHYAGTYGLVAALTRFHPTILTAWGSDVLFAGQEPLTRPFIRMALKHADLLTCDADHMKDAMVKLGADAARIELVRFGITVKPILPDQKLEARKNLDLKGGPIVISARNLEPVYDVVTFIRAIPAVLATFPTTTFLVLGDGSQRGELEAEADRLGIRSAIEFCGAVGYQKVEGYLMASDVYVSTSLSDAGLASATGEAMVLGLPVVVTDSDENRNWVQNGREGFIFPPSDHESLGEELGVLLGDTALRETMGAAGRSVITERNNYEIEMKRMEDLCLRTIRAFSVGHTS